MTPLNKNCIFDIKDKKRFFNTFPDSFNRLSRSIITEEKAIYQNGKKVGDIDGEVKEIEGEIIFQEIYNTSKLNRNLPIEYKRYKLKIIRIGTEIGLSSNGKIVKQGIIKNVICWKVK